MVFFNHPFMSARWPVKKIGELTEFITLLIETVI
jgi:hypothetical protein